MIPDEGISGPYYAPLLIAGIVYALLGVIGAAARTRSSERAEQLADLQFGLVLLAAAYTVVLVLAAAFDKFDLVKDLVEVIAIVVVFFALLLVVMLVVFERGFGALLRSRRR